MGGGEHLDSLKPVQEGGEAGCEREEGGVAGRREEQRDEEEEEIDHITDASFQTLQNCQFSRDTRRGREVQVTEDFTSDLLLGESHHMGGGQTKQDMMGFES